MSAGMVYGLVSSHLNGADPIEFFCSVDGMSFENLQNFETRKERTIMAIIILNHFLWCTFRFPCNSIPLMARCAENEKEGRFIFYGAMIQKVLLL